VWYTIEYLNEREDGGRRVVSPMVFRDKETALESACALLRAGFPVSKVAGPDFTMSQIALAAYAQGQRNRRNA